MFSANTCSEHFFAIFSPLFQNLTEKIDTDSGEFVDADSTTYSGVTVDMISYDETNKQLLMKVDGADTVIPFRSKHLVGQVPKMTSNTAPYGTAFASSEYSGYPAWKVFDKSGSTFWISTGNTNQYVGYHFTKPVRINSIKIASYGTGHNGIKNFKVQYSNDGTNYTDVYSDVMPDNTDPTATFTYSFDNDISAEYWRLFIIDEYPTTNNIQFGELQFYAWQQLPTVIDYPID